MDEVVILEEDDVFGVSVVKIVVEIVVDSVDNGVVVVVVVLVESILVWINDVIASGVGDIMVVVTVFTVVRGVVEESIGVVDGDELLSLFCRMAYLEFEFWCKNWGDFFFISIRFTLFFAWSCCLSAA